MTVFTTEGAKDYNEFKQEFLNQSCTDTEFREIFKTEQNPKGYTSKELAILLEHKRRKNLIIVLGYVFSALLITTLILELSFLRQLLS